MRSAINKRHRYLIRRNGYGYVGSTNDLGQPLPDGHCLVDTIGEDGLGTVDGRKGIRDFLKAEEKAIRSLIPISGEAP